MLWKYGQKVHSNLFPLLISAHNFESETETHSFSFNSLFFSFFLSSLEELDGERLTQRSELEKGTSQNSLFFFEKGKKGIFPIQHALRDACSVCSDCINSFNVSLLCSRLFAEQPNAFELLQFSTLTPRTAPTSSYFYFILFSCAGSYCTSLQLLCFLILHVYCSCNMMINK